MFKLKASSYMLSPLTNRRSHTKNVVFWYDAFLQSHRFYVQVCHIEFPPDSSLHVLIRDATVHSVFRISLIETSNIFDLGTRSHVRDQCAKLLCYRAHAAHYLRPTFRA